MPLNATARPQGAAACVMILFVALTTLGSLVLAHCLFQIWRGRASRHWPTTIGTIGPRPMSRSVVFPIPLFFGRFVYTYRIGAREFKGRRIWFGSDLAFSVPNPAYTWLGESLPPGTSVSVSYNPANRRESVLRPGVSPGTYVYAGVSIAMILGGIGVLWFAV